MLLNSQHKNQIPHAIVGLAFLFLLSTAGRIEKEAAKTKKLQPFDVEFSIGEEPVPSLGG